MTPSEVADVCRRVLSEYGETAGVSIVLPGKWRSNVTTRRYAGVTGHINGRHGGSVIVQFPARELLEAAEREAGKMWRRAKQ